MSTVEIAIQPAARNYWIDNLRGTITLLVVAHHAALAYATFGYFDKKQYIRSTHPIVDSVRWVGMDIFINFNDIFFMPLMFLVSGLFIFSTLQKKGGPRTLTGRIKRLGIPFLIGVTLLIPVAYMPSYFLMSHFFNLKSFIADYLINEQWPVGPPWFIWLLLAFSCLACLIPPAVYKRATVTIVRLSARPWHLLALWYLIIGLALIPLSLWIGQYTWTGIGPFDFQLNRVAFYLFFFLTGSLMGAFKWEQVLFTGERLLNQSWQFWTSLALTGFGLIEFITYVGFTIFASWGFSSFLSNLIFELFFVGTCIFTCLAFLVYFKVRVNYRSDFWESLSENAYGIYLTHYIFITWLQFALLNIHLPATAKFAIVFIVSAAASWWMVMALRKIKGIANII